MAAGGISAAIGGRIRELRRHAGHTQDDLAMLARELGLGWQRSTVASIEAGNRNLTLEEVVLLPLLMETLLGERGVTFYDLLPQDGGTIDLGPTGTADVDWIVDRLSGAPPDAEGVGFWNNEKGGDIEGPVARWRERTADGARPALHLTPRRVRLGHTRSDSSSATQRDAEQKAARSLGIPVGEVVALAIELWGHGLTEEREARLEANLPRTPTGRIESRSDRARAIRGHITRQLMAEIEARMPPASDRGDH